MNARAVLLGAVMVVGSAGMPSTQGPPSLPQFDEAVAGSRRVMRQYCGIAQEMAAAGQTSPVQQERALTLLREARGQWRAIHDRYSKLPPPEYARDTDFPNRLQDIANAMDDMERALAAGQPRWSSRACGYGCSLFVAMHEENGLDYALDRLFHLRKDIKAVQVLMGTQGLQAVRGRISGLLQKRDAVLSAPPPFPPADPRRASYDSSVDDVSRALNDLARVAASGDADAVKKALGDCGVLVNKPYGMAL